MDSNHVTEVRPAAGSTPSRRSPALRASGVLLAWATATLMGCTDARNDAAVRASDRSAGTGPVLPATEPQRRFQLAREGRFRVIDSWSPAQRIRERAWSLGAERWTTAPGGGIRIHSAYRRVDLDLGGAGASRGCSALRARVGGLISSGWLELIEREAGGERLVAKASARDAPASPGGLFTYLLVPVVRSGGGPDDRRALRFRGTDEALVLDRVECLGLDPAPGDVATGDADARRIEIDDEVRSGWLAAPGDRWVKELDWKDATALTLELGQIAGSPTEVEIELRGGRGAGPSPNGSESSTRRIRTTGKWQSVRFERGAGDGEHVSLEVRVPRDASAIVAVSTLDLEPPRATPGLDGIVLISIDTLRADRMSLYGNPRRTTPRIDAWAERSGVIFDQAIAAAASTLPSHASLLTGKDVLDHGAVLGIPLAEEEVTVAERLAARGWRTSAITGGGYLHPSYQLDQGFQQYRAWPRRPGFNPDELEAGVEAALRFLDTPSRRPFFLFFHTYRVHYPYRGEEPFYSTWTGRRSDATIEILPATVDAVWGRLLSSRSATIHDGTGTKPLLPGQGSVVVDQYDAGVAAMDAALAPLLDRLESMARGGSRIGVILTSDHGESLGESGFLGHGYLFDSNLRVPLVVAVPDEAHPGRRLREQVRGVDVAATVLALAGEEVAPELDGEPLVRAGEVDLRSHPAEAWSYSAESRQGLSLRAGDRKLMLDDAVGASPGPRARAFRLGVDVEESGIGSVDPGSADAMTRRALRYWSEATGGNVLRLSTKGDSGWSGTAHGNGFSDEWLRVFPDGAAAEGLTPDGGDGVRIRLSAGRELALRWWDPASRTRVRFASEPPAEPGDWWMDLEAAKGCRGPDLRSDPQARLQVVFRRRWRCGEEGPHQADANAAEQLKALGYLQ